MQSFKSQQTSYYHLIKAGSVVKKSDTRLNELIEFIFEEGKNTYGTRKIKDKLLSYYGLFVSRRRIANIMKELNLKVKMKRRSPDKSLKNELVYQTTFYTKKQAKQEIFKYIEFFYNIKRPHSYLNGLSPVEFEQKEKILRSEIAA